MFYPEPQPPDSSFSLLFLVHRLRNQDLAGYAA